MDAVGNSHSPTLGPSTWAKLSVSLFQLCWCALQESLSQLRCCSRDLASSLGPHQQFRPSPTVHRAGEGLCNHVILSRSTAVDHLVNSVCRVPLGSSTTIVQYTETTYCFKDLGGQIQGFVEGYAVQHVHDHVGVRLTAALVHEQPETVSLG